MKLKSFKKQIKETERKIIKYQRELQQIEVEENNRLDILLEKNETGNSEHDRTIVSLQKILKA